MIAIKIKNTKAFMSKLLTKELFDEFFLVEATIDTYNTFHIDGLVHKDFYKYDDTFAEVLKDKYSKWAVIKPIALDLIKGKRTPLGFKFILQLDEKLKNTMIKEAETDILPDQVALGLNIRFSNEELILTSGISYEIFTLDKSLEKAWDDYLPRFLSDSEIDNEIM